MGRQFAAIIELDEDIAIKNSEACGLCDMTPGDYLEKEFGWLEQSGITLEQWLITDYDDEVRWARYINYLIDWALSYSSEEFDGMSPACYDEWCDCEDEDGEDYD